MSAQQAKAAVVGVGNRLFDREWTFHDDDSNTIDLESLPDGKIFAKQGRK